MIKWKPSNEIIIIPNRYDYSYDEYISMWHTRRSFYDMVNNNLEQLYKEDKLQKYYLVNFGRRWNIHYKNNTNGETKVFKNPEYYRWKYMEKLGFPVVEYSYHYKQQILKSRKSRKSWKSWKMRVKNKFYTWFNNLINVIKNI
jgi:hypothetical protein